MHFQESNMKIFPLIPLEAQAFGPLVYTGDCLLYHENPPTTKPLEISFFVIVDQNLVWVYDIITLIANLHILKTGVQYRANVSWQSRLETRSSMLEAIEDRASRFEARVSSIEFRDTRRIFRGSRKQLSRKRLISRTSNNKREKTIIAYCSSRM